MALDTIRGEAVGGMVRCLGRRVFVLVAAEAIVSDTIELQRVAGGVAIRAAQVAMRTHEGETVLLVQFRNGVNDPIQRCVATSTIVADAHPMHIRVASRTVHWCSIENQRSVARFAIHFRMGSFQREIRGIVPEYH